jgi:hypothetical protein
MSNATLPFTYSQLANLELVGKYFTNQEYLVAKLVYYLSIALSIFSLIALLIGLFTLELAGLELCLLNQSIFVQLFAFKNKLPLPLLALQGLKYTMGIQMETETGYKTTQQHQYQILGLYDNIFYLNFNFNIALYIAPFIICLFFVCYYVRYNHLQVR